jgi:serine-type D-Ala-D-Ala carboxypeptidase (penicillin-binding protein 5/6)
VVLEKTSPGDVVTASARAEAVGANDALITELELVAGERLTVEHLLYGLLLPSGSDAAVALAEHTAGSIPAFARLMNERARALGAVDSNFTNADGLDDPAAYSTAYDLALITRAAMRNDLFRKIIATPNYEIPWPGRPAPRRLVNRNQLLGRFPGTTGVKTGNTRLAGPTLVASARRGSEERISVLLGSPDPFAESERVLEFGFTAFERISIVRSGQQWGQLTYGDGTTHRLVATRDVSLLVGASGPRPRVRYRPQGSVLVVDVPEGLTIPLEMRCKQEPCRPPERRASLLAGLVSLFGPALSILK